MTEKISSIQATYLEKKAERKWLVKQANAKIARLENARISQTSYRGLENLQGSYTSVTLRPFWIMLLIFALYFSFLKITNRTASALEGKLLFLIMSSVGILTGILMIKYREMAGKFRIIRGREAVFWGWVLAVFWSILLASMIINWIIGG